ncbi:hypothetical protein KKF84_08380, partial [Myxococcota bacterium]|nr:hypothetical protein [Myxococcota bacterium]
MFQLVPLASVLQPPEDTERMVGEISKKLIRHNLAHQIVKPGAPLSSESPAVLLTVTGGTEHMVMQRAKELQGPIILAAHPSSNSFPAALEVLARLQQLNRKGKIVMLGDRDEDFLGLQRLLHAVQVHREISQTRLGVFGEPSDWLIAGPSDQETMAELFRARFVKVPMAEIISGMDDIDDEQANGFLRSFVEG